MDLQFQEISIEDKKAMDSIERNEYKIWFEEDILWVEYLTEELDIKGVDQGVKDRLKLIEGKPRLTIMDARNIKRTSKAVITRCQEKDAQSGFVACAMVTDSKFTVLLFYLIQLAVKTPFELKLFTNMEKAKRWINNKKK